MYSTYAVHSVSGRCYVHTQVVALRLVYNCSIFSTSEAGGSQLAVAGKIMAMNSKVFSQFLAGTE